MLSWEGILQDYIIKYSDKIKKTTRPLRDHFGIGYFTYHRIDHEGKYTVLVDRPDWAEYYVSSQIYLNDPYLRHPSVYQSGFDVVEGNGSEEYREMVLKAGKKVLNMDMGVLLIEKNADGVEFFGFSGNKQTSALESLYSNHPQIFKSFASHFRKEMASQLSQMQEAASSLIDLKGDDFLCKDPICPEIDPEQRLAFYKSIGLQSEIEKVQKLSLRERQCLKLLMEGRTAKDVAVVLQLSPRTVESYFENIKDKLSCWSRHELIAIARQYHELGIL